MVDSNGNSERKTRNDKGKRRTNYRQKKRLLRSIGNNLKHTLEDIKRFELLEIKRAERDKLLAIKKAAAKMTPAQVRARREARHAKRSELLQRLAANRICICCEKKRYSSKSWVYINGQIEMLICKGCVKRFKDAFGSAFLLKLEEHVLSLKGFSNGNDGGRTTNS